MKRIGSLLLAGLFVLASCAKKTDHEEHNHEAMETENPNQVLYNQVMDVHDEVMPKMETLYNIKKDLEGKLSQTEGLTDQQKKELEQRIHTVDSVSKMMMDWMHEFNPLPDTVDQEKAREYLESEMEKIKKVKEAMLETLEKEKQ